MKLNKFRKKLNLNKKTIADLNNNAMKEINGGNSITCLSCVMSWCRCPTSGFCTGTPCKVC